MPARVTFQVGGPLGTEEFSKREHLDVSRYNELVQVFAFSWDTHTEQDLSTQNHSRSLNILNY